MSAVHVVDQAKHAVLDAPFQREAAKSVVTTSTSGGFHIPKDASFVQYQPGFAKVLGEAPSLRVVAEKDWPWAHEAGIYLKDRNSIFITSNQVTREDGEKDIIISEVQIGSPQDKAYKVIQYDEQDHGIRMGNGGINYIDGMLFCDQGYGTNPSALKYVKALPDGRFTTQTIINNFHGRHFNSLNDVVVHPNGTIWFTDPSYGSEQGFKSAPQLPNQVYCFNPQSGDLRVVANNIPKCNGIAFSPAFDTCYVTDTEFIRGDGHIDVTRGGWIYAFDVKHYQGSQGPAYLTNKRIFAYTDTGAPDGIKCDADGNVYAGCFDGVHVWDAQGTLIGKIILPNSDGCANLVFGPPGTLYIMAEQRLYEARLASRGVLVS